MVEITPLREIPGNQASVIRNETCPYCGTDLNIAPWNTEHVVGRRFVPKGSLDGHYNIILRACITCNSKKAVLENDTSAITLFSAASDLSGLLDKKFIDQANHKASRALSRKTRRPVSDSYSIGKISKIENGEVSVLHEIAMAPQLETDSALQLAHLHVLGLFYFATWNEAARRGYTWPGTFVPLVIEHRSNWGGSYLSEFSRVTNNWRTCLLTSIGNDFFRGHIREHPEFGIYSWALEWNKVYRLAGFMGDRSRIEDLHKIFQVRADLTYQLSDGTKIYMENSIGLPPSLDEMFIPRAG